MCGDEGGDARLPTSLLDVPSPDSDAIPAEAAGGDPTTSKLLPPNSVESSESPLPPTRTSLTNGMNT